MILKEYKKRLSKHDWYYSSSGDRRIYESGLAEEKELKKLAETNVLFQRAYDAMRKKIFPNSK